MTERIVTPKGLFAFLFVAFRAYRGDPVAAVQTIKTVAETAKKVKERVEGGEG